MSLNNKNIVVTGASRGIGKAIVELFIHKGANVFFTYCNNEAAAKSIVDGHASGQGAARAYHVDAKDPEGAANFIKTVEKEFGAIDVLVNNAGVRRDKTLLYMQKKDWDFVMETNLASVFYMTHALIPFMLKRKQGRIINISSISGVMGLAGQTNYSASKAGILGFTKALAKEVAAHGVCVNAVAAGPVSTEMLDGLSEKKVSELLQNVPVKRLCTPYEVAVTVAFLSDRELAPDYLTGQTIILDGGMGL